MYLSLSVSSSLFFCLSLSHYFLLFPYYYLSIIINFFTLSDSSSFASIFIFLLLLLHRPCLIIISLSLSFCYLILALSFSLSLYLSVTRSIFLTSVPLSFSSTTFHFYSSIIPSPLIGAKYFLCVFLFLFFSFGNILSDYSGVSVSAIVIFSGRKMDRN